MVSTTVWGPGQFVSRRLISGPELLLHHFNPLACCQSSGQSSAPASEFEAMSQSIVGALFLSLFVDLCAFLLFMLQ